MNSHNNRDADADNINGNHLNSDPIVEDEDQEGSSFEEESHQTYILEQIATFLKFRYEKKFGKNQIPSDLQCILDSLNEGHCVSFSVLHGAKNAVNKLDSWRYDLTCIELWNWENDPNFLNKKIEELSDLGLPEFVKIIPSNINGEEKANLLKTTLKSIFIRTANDVIYHRSLFESPFRPDYLNEFTILCPNILGGGESLFQILDKGKILSIIDRQIPAIGHVSFEKLNAVLNLSDENQEICLIHNLDHTIHVGKEKGQWFIYDPDYEHSRDTQEVCYDYAKFYPKKKAIEQIFMLQGRDIVVEMASIYHKLSSPSFTITTKEEQIQFITHYLSVKSLILLAQYAKSILIQLIQYMFTHENSYDLNLLRETVIKLFTFKNAYNERYTGLQYIAQFAPDALELLIRYMEGDYPGAVELKANFITMLSLTNAKGWTGFYSIAYYAPNSLSLLIQIMASDNCAANVTLQYSFADAIGIKNSSDRSALDVMPRNSFTVRAIVRYAPRFVPELMMLIKDNVELLYADCGLQNGLTLSEQLLADVLILTHNHLIEKKIGQVIFNALSARLNSQIIQKIVQSFHGSLQYLVKLSIYRELAIIEMMKPLPNIRIIGNALALGKEVWSVDAFPYSNREGYLSYLTIAEQAIVCAYFTDNSILIQYVFAELKKENVDINAAMIKKISTIFIEDDVKNVIHWIEEQLEVFSNPELANLKKRKLTRNHANEQIFKEQIISQLPSKKFKGFTPFFSTACPNELGSNETGKIEIKNLITPQKPT